MILIEYGLGPWDIRHKFTGIYFPNGMLHTPVTYEIIGNNNASIGRIHKRGISIKTMCKTNKKAG